THERAPAWPLRLRRNPSWPEAGGTVTANPQSYFFMNLANLLKFQNQAGIEAKRSGENAEMSADGRFPIARSAMMRAGNGDRQMPLGKWPLARNKPGVAVAPRRGRSSGVPGRRPAQLSVTAADAS